MNQCVVSLANRTIIDYVRDNGLTQIFGKTLDQVREKYPDAQIMGADEAVRSIETSLIDTDATEITEEQFISALEALPPKRWQSYTDTESFLMSEYLYGYVTSVYARVGNRYYTFHDRCTLSHDDIIRKVAMTQVKNQAAA